MKSLSKKRLKNFFSKKYKYSSGRVCIKSELKLNEENIGDIINIVNETMKTSAYEPCYFVSRRVYYEINLPIEAVYSNKTRKKFWITISKRVWE